MEIYLDVADCHRIIKKNNLNKKALFDFSLKSCFEVNVLQM